MRTVPESRMVEIREKKPGYPVSDAFADYLRRYQRNDPVDVVYEDLRRFTQSIPYETPDGEESYWESVLYSPGETDEIHRELTRIYAYMRTPEDPGFTEHLSIERVDFCRFGNSQPFRIKVVNKYNDVHDYYYVKNTDASRAYGLELEHILAPNRINFLVHKSTLIEEHISGIPGDVFLEERFPKDQRGLTRFAKEFVKFNERCFVKLLGDMRAYNFVVVLTEDFDMRQFRIRAIDFDQQSFEGELKIYLAQFYPENKKAVDMVWKLLPQTTIRQYQREERSLIRRRLNVARQRFDALMECMCADVLSTPDRIARLSAKLARYHHDDSLASIKGMGELTRRHMHKILETE